MMQRALTHSGLTPELLLLRLAAPDQRRRGVDPVRADHIPVVDFRGRAAGSERGGASLMLVVRSRPNESRPSIPLRWFTEWSFRIAVLT